MDPRAWTSILSRIAPRDADDLDDLTGRYDPRRAEPGRDIFAGTGAVLMPRAAMKREDAVCVGLRTSGFVADAADRAARLAAFALERDVEVVILTDCDLSGFERFGFRTERVAGETEAERAACEDQIRRFWNIDLML